MKIDIFGYEYDETAAPAFIVCGDYLFHRPTARLLSAASVDAYAHEKNYTFSADERGPAPDKWDDDNFGPWASAMAGPNDTPPPPAEIAPGAVAPTVTGATTNSATINVNTSGKVLSAAGTATIVIDPDGGGDQTVTAQLAKGETGHQIAVAIAAAINTAAITDVTATAAGSAVTVANAGGNFTKLTIAIA